MSGLDGVNKLQLLMKELKPPNPVPKPEYNYSAIFEASKSNIRQRNKTTYDPKNEK
jgi:hypothetical protein